ncbi:amylo-alpha-16-glucosidase [Nocardioides sp. J2M5]|uniref:glycogen debranching N-terminal domain-containing protein n=1 Tax=Nocardioides palaemonis TaxID=2829810 RepID=UPI001BAAAC97|nr:glycogen debranching N-terminal domain-containing protein [Nocardioides palaemonis]MBS2939174.1 amylo-alpha-16-glucosidase [Nocardioides palaemonis]
MTEATHDIAPTTTPAGAPSLQPLLHDLASCVAAPGVLLGSPDGQLRRGGVSGWYVADTRLLDRWEVSVAGSDLDLVRAENRGAARHAFTYLARSLGDLSIADPTVRIDRVRVLAADGLREELTFLSTAPDPVAVVLHVDLGTDLAAMPHVKQGRATEPLAATAAGSGLAWEGPEGSVRVAAEDGDARPDVDAGAGRLTWHLELERGVPQVVSLRATTSVPGLFGSGRPAPWSADVDAHDVRLVRVVRQGLDDLAGLLLDDDGDAFLAAGSPWFLTLFGRDSLWAARMLLPLDTGLALSTLRVLARRQGRVDDPATEEQPGKILHEVRGQVLDLGEQRLPPLYYGTVDATPLFVCVLADALAWGADRDEVRALVPAARACLEWVLAQAAGSGWLTYVDHTGEGLSNQGWKDSHDSIQFADGRLAEAPISLSEVQAYAHEAAVRGAALLADLGADPVPGLEEWAADLRDRFGTDFWVDAADGGHVAVALDRDGARVDSVASNMGHLLGTGVLGADATARVADLLADPSLDAGFGLRTLSSRSPRFSTLSYHGGTVWPHDTAIAVRGLAAEGRYEEAGALAAGLVRASEFFDHRLPELYGGDAADDVAQPTAYPAACRPQAWAAAAPVACLVALGGVRTDPATRTLSHPARTTGALGGWTLRGLRLGPDAFDLSVDPDGRVSITLPPGSPLVVEVRAADA